MIEQRKRKGKKQSLKEMHVHTQTHIRTDFVILAHRCGTCVKVSCSTHCTATKERHWLLLSLQPVTTLQVQARMSRCVLCVCMFVCACVHVCVYMCVLVL